MAVAPVLEEVCRTWTRETGVPATLEEAGDPVVVGGDAGALVLRTVREALVNVRKHAAARSVRVRLRGDDAAIGLEIEDDGAGPGAADARRRGHGLGSLGVAARRLGGELRLDAAVPHGARLCLSLPAPSSAPGVAGPRRAVKRIRVLIADNHPVVRTGLAGMLGTQPDLEVVAAVASGDEAVRVAAELSPDVILMDLRMPGMDGHQAIRALAAAGTVRKVIVLTTYQSDADVAPVLAAGASGYLLKDVPADDLFAAIRAVAGGGKAIASTVAAQREARGATALSVRELEVVRLVARGLSNREIGAALFVARRRSRRTSCTSSRSSACRSHRRRDARAGARPGGARSYRTARQRPALSAGRHVPERHRVSHATCPRLRRAVSAVMGPRPKRRAAANFRRARRWYGDCGRPRMLSLEYQLRFSRSDSRHDGVR